MKKDFPTDARTKISTIIITTNILMVMIIIFVIFDRVQSVQQKVESLVARVHNELVAVAEARHSTLPASKIESVALSSEPHEAESQSDVLQLALQLLRAVLTLQVSRSADVHCFDHETLRLSWIL